MDNTPSHGTKRKFSSVKSQGVSAEMVTADSPPMPPPIPRSGYCYGPTLGMQGVIGQGRGHGQVFDQGRGHEMRFTIGLGHGHGQRFDQGQGQRNFLGQGYVAGEGQGLAAAIPMESDENDESVYRVPADEQMMDF
ncbi:hypothetical protein KR074_006237 [Drosophila pseudoananassae]|nr:hypothetical protein KR074_006237 [Drosophila pseudoananassae]